MEAGEILGVSQKLGDKRSSKDPAKKIVEPAASVFCEEAGPSLSALIFVGPVATVLCCSKDLSLSSKLVTSGLGIAGVRTG